ncbi:DNA alkylation repair protein [Hazenella coriacea]|uniref:DNA alkylation repair protein n=1 Tax=Hazenella coriacea TaxID=1179467 RepID=A0A4R3LBN4_9BACL|nr:DNA alkylation repair protein [Hazenella coriacea]TCS96640.1 hypothetical protein EDD58_101276 [Hazenella coriacea]
MSFPYLCPHCGTNRSRFNLIEQVVQSVKKDRETGDVIEYLDPDDPLQFKYDGDPYRVQCGVCGMVEAERLFIQQARIHQS